MHIEPLASSALMSSFMSFIWWSRCNFWALDTNVKACEVCTIGIHWPGGNLIPGSWEWGGSRSKSMCRDVWSLYRAIKRAQMTFWLSKFFSRKIWLGWHGCRRLSQHSRYGSFQCQLWPDCVITWFQAEEPSGINAVRHCSRAKILLLRSLGTMVHSAGVDPKRLKLEFYNRNPTTSIRVVLCQALWLMPGLKVRGCDLKVLPHWMSRQSRLQNCGEGVSELGDADRGRLINSIRDQPHTLFGFGMMQHNPKWWFKLHNFDYASYHRRIGWIPLWNYVELGNFEFLDSRRCIFSYSFRSLISCIKEMTKGCARNHLFWTKEHTCGNVCMSLTICATNLRPIFVTSLIQSQAGFAEDVCFF